MNRRQFLGNASLGAGGMLLSPVLAQVAGQANGASAPKRFVFVLESNGRPPQFLQPTGISLPGNGTQVSSTPILAENTLPRGLAPLAPYRNKLTVIQGLSGKVCYPGAHSANFGALGCFRASSPGDNPRTGSPLGETIDAALARSLPPTVLRQLVLGISSDPGASIIYNCSATAARRPVPTVCRPDLAYSSIFGGVAQGSARQQFNARRNLLDFMVENVRSAESQLAGPEREKFEQHLAAFEALRNRQSRLNEIENTLRRHAPVVTDKYRSEIESDRLDAHFDLGTAALVGGLTNVLTIASGTGGAHMSVRFRGLGINVAKHELGHNSPDRGKSAEECLDIIRAFHMELIVRLMRRLEAVREGNGTMLDNTLIVFLSDAGGEHHPRFDQWPVLLIGDLGGRLRAGGRVLGYPRYGVNGHRTMANLYTTLLQATGSRQNSFGHPDPNLRDLDQRGPLNELLA